MSTNQQEPYEYAWSIPGPSSGPPAQHFPAPSFTTQPGPVLPGFGSSIPPQFHDSGIQLPDYGTVDAEPAAPTGTQPLGDYRPHTPRRVKYKQLDWDAHKKTIKRLYLDQNKRLTDTMDIMKRLYSFDASQKLYKAKFKEWRWQKNLPVEMALVMDAKAKRRKEEQNKETIFKYGGQIWTPDRIGSTISRAPKQLREEKNLSDEKTPQELVYDTPGDVSVVSQTTNASPVAAQLESDTDSGPFGAEAMEISDDDPDDEPDYDSDSAQDHRPASLRLTWNGYSVSDLDAVLSTALNYRNSGKFDDAEKTFHKVISGMEHLLGKTNEDTVKATYNLADLYADSDQMDRAMAVVEKVIRNHIDILGFEARQTQQAVSHVAEILNGWNRHDVALGLLSSFTERRKHSGLHRCGKRGKKRGRRAKGKEKAVEVPNTNGAYPDLSDATQQVLDNPTMSMVNYGLGIASRHVQAKNNGAEVLLQAMINTSENKPEFRVQHLRARAELLKLYKMLGQPELHDDAFQDALRHLTEAWRQHEWELEQNEIEDFEFLEAGLQLIANIHKCGYATETQRLFHKAAENARTVFGPEDERTVWVLISIGLVYQNHSTWDEAEEWFDAAFAAALSNPAWGKKDGIVKSLQNALDRRHFSYVSNEGRPFRTIFGVSGIKIMPGRLHLE